MKDDDKKLWDGVVAAERQVIEARAAFFQKAESRTAALAIALQGDAWNQRAALSFLSRFSYDALELLDPLVELALSSDWQLEVADIIASGIRHKPKTVTPKLRDIVRAKLDGADVDDYLVLAGLLKYIGDNEMLAELVQTAKASSDDEIREVGKDLSQG